MAEAPSTSKSIFEKVKAGYSALYLQTSEDIRSQREVKSALQALNEGKSDGRKLFVWTPASGLREDETRKPPIEDTQMPPGALIAMKEGKLGQRNLVILRHFHHYLDDPQIQGLLLDLIPAFKKTSNMLIITAPVVKIPPELEKEIALIDLQLPGPEQLGDVLDGIISGSKLTGDKVPNAELRKELIAAGLGLTTSEAENAFALSLVRPSMNKTAVWDPKIVLEEKCQALKKTGLLEYIPVAPEGMQQVGGLENLKTWVSKRKRAFTEEAKKFGLPSPKGILLVGPPGCGKSLSAKAISGELHLPLIRLDMGKMFSGIVGSSEANMRNAIKIAEAVSPCILWIDEIEKGLAGSGAGSLDSGVGARVLGTILTWMQDKSSPVFVYATANDVAGLPPELLRKGRFDEMFSVDLPTEGERAEIFSIHLRNKNREKVLSKTLLTHFAGEASEGFTGAEIEAALNDSLYSAFFAKRELNQDDLQEALDSTLPLSKMMAEKIIAIRAWCKQRTRAANKGEEVKVVMAGQHGRAVEA